MSDESNTPVYWRTVILVDVLLIAVGVWMVSRGWTDVGEVVVFVSVIGLPVSVWKLIQVSRQQPPAEE
ncbi:hypothetical protein EKO23_08835 [Nocardioides guangzhouensis]|uniref:Uncharacterized protein n=1 Tax=Nocardioides guangzhouensis TaxID=2497878 RepID=A0A4Q4ZGZ0_9ACTN|nr:hypothetical protein [Nocardioides guangzhouensis]RYP86751.1 hypothetical protein EKO23_08835 [Nocardioides guangzhouensis]